MGFIIYATEHTAEALHSAGLNNVSVLHKVKEPHMNPNILEYLQKRKIDLVINIPNANNQDKYSEILEDEYIIRRLAVEFGIPVVTNLELASALVKVLKHHNYNVLAVRSLNEYMNGSMWKFW
jgi:carbamoyl-phosphate synthase large subunit